MNKLMLTVASLALIGMASPAFAQSSAAPSDNAPMSSTGATSAASPPDSSASASPDKSTKAAHKTHHAKSMGTTKASGRKSTDHDAEMLNQQELGKIQQH